MDKCAEVAYMFVCVFASVVRVLKHEGVRDNACIHMCMMLRNLLFVFKTTDAFHFMNVADANEGQRPLINITTLWVSKSKAICLGVMSLERSVLFGCLYGFFGSGFGRFDNFSI